MPPSTMRAWQYSSRGTPRDTVKLNHSAPVPAIESGTKVLVKVAYVGMNPSLADLVMQIPIPFRPTSTCELEFSGVIIQVGPEVDPDLQPGTQVFGVINDIRHFLEGAGAMAEYIVVYAKEIRPLPKGISMREAAGLSCAGQTALNMCQQAKVAEGQKVFVNGASGGVGICCVQIAKAMGAQVVATCSEASRELVESLGADEIIDYQANAPLSAFLARELANKPFDSILDAIGVQALYEASPSYMKPTGLYACAGAHEGLPYILFNVVRNYFLPNFLGGTNRRWMMIRTVLSEDKARQLAQWVEEGKLKVPLDSTYSVENLFAAFDRVLSKRAKGKIIVKIQDV